MNPVLQLGGDMYLRKAQVFVSCLGLVSSVSLASAAESSAAASDAKSSMSGLMQNKKFGEDQRITDIELKAQSGSLSQYSLKFDLSYSGPPVDNLNDPEMPNPDNRPRNNRTSLGGYMGLRYRLSSQDEFNVSTGLKWFSPYHQMAGEQVNKRVGEKDYEIANPQVSYDRTYAVDQVQMRSSFKVSSTTADFYQDRGQVASAGVTQGLKYSVLQTRWIAGLIADFDYYFFDRSYASTDGKMATYYFSLIPSLEYRLTDQLTAKTSIGYAFSNLRKYEDWKKWDQPLAMQRLGVGWAITRDIYFNPYINFFTEKPAIRTTSLSFSTVFSIF